MNSDDPVDEEITKAIDELNNKNIQIPPPLMIKAANKLAFKAQLDQADNLYKKVKENNPEFEISPKSIIRLSLFFAMEKRYKGIHDFHLFTMIIKSCFVFRYGSNSSFLFP